MVLFVIVSFILIVHMLNFLIAIMGGTFSKNQENEDENRMKSRLNIVID